MFKTRKLAEAVQHAFDLSLTSNRRTTPQHETFYVHSYRMAGQDAVLYSVTGQPLHEGCTPVARIEAL